MGNTKHEKDLCLSLWTILSNTQALINNLTWSDLSRSVVPYWPVSAVLYALFPAVGFAGLLLLETLAYGYLKKTDFNMKPVPAAKPLYDKDTEQE